jgi:hypothetical protein
VAGTRDGGSGTGVIYLVTDTHRFQEAAAWSAPIRGLGLAIEGTELADVLAEFERELDRVGIMRLRPRYYLSTEWGVPFESIAIAIPFYLVRADLMALQREQNGYVEGVGRADILRYLRHEMGHVMNYGYRLYDDPEWVERFGSMTQPYEEEYRPQPFSRRFVVHLPGWYAQKHPDEDWSETFAVWMTPGRDWRAEYAGWPEALAKLEYCDRVVAAVRACRPVVTSAHLDEDVAELDVSVQEWFAEHEGAAESMPPGLDGALRAIFDDLHDAAATPGRTAPAEALLGRMQPLLMENVYRWTGHFPESTRALVRYLRRRAADFRLCYAPARENAAVVAVTTLVTALAMNHVARGSYLP